MTPRAAKLRAERIREVYGRDGTPIYASPIILAYLVLQTATVLWIAARPPLAGVWVAAMLLLELGHGLLLRAFHRRPRQDDELAGWGRARAAFETLHGLGWSSSAILLHPAGEPVTLLGVVMTVMALVTANGASLAVHVPSMLGFVAAALAPTIAILVVGDGGRVEFYGAVMLSTASLLILANAFRMSAVYDEGIRLRLDLSEQLDERRGLLEAAEEGRLAAESADAERTRFFGAASHDLRQPVHALGLYASLLRRDPPARERRELITNVIACVDSLDRLFAAILGVARAAGSDRRRNLGAVDLSDVLRAVVLQLGPEAEKRGLEIRLRPTCARVLADPSVVERIVTNLVANAIRYTEHGGVVVGARTRGSVVALVVADTGIGLAEPDRERIFEPFYQVQPRQGGAEQGFGLGLATVRQLCQRYGYGVELRSRPDRGARFTITLPAFDPAAASEPALEQPPRPPEPDEAPPRQNVLVVEDDALVADAVQRMLESWGVVVRVCSSAEEALAVLDRAGAERWHALLDYRLPGERTGLDIAEEIRARHGAAVRIALVTGEADPAIFEAAERRGVIVLQKPVRPIRLRALLASETAAPAPAL